MSHIYNEIFDPKIYENVNSQSKELLADYILSLKENRRSAFTIKQYSSNLRNIFCDIYRNFENKSVLDLTKKEIRKYSLSLIEERGLSNARRNCLVSCLRCILAYAELDDDWEYSVNNSRVIKDLSKEPVKQIIFLSNDTIMRLYDKLVAVGELQKACLLLLSYDSAARRSELAQVKKESFLDPTRNNSNQVIGKGHKRFNLIYFEKTRQSALAWLRQRGEDKFPGLFVDAYEIGDKHEITPDNIYYNFVFMRRYLTELNGAEIDFGPHSMRHSSLQNYKTGEHHVCKDLGIGSFQIDQLQIIAHHSSSNTTQNYLPDSSIDELNKMFGIEIK